MKHKGFTLVELAIVMTIIGLLIGGILKGQELLENARVTSTIAQVKSYDAAITAFRDIYDYLPGDLPNAGDKISGCNESCTPYMDASSTGGTAGDGLVGFNIAGVECIDGPGNQRVQLSRDSGDEGYLMWVHLLKSNFITGVTDIALYEEVARSPGLTDPAGKIGGGFFPGSNLCTDNAVSISTVKGLSLALTMGVYNLWDTVTDSSLRPNVMTPSRAAQIDRKMDDGKPQSGTIKAIGDRVGYCDTADNEYAESVATKDCGLLIGIQQ